jgi:hypothetical protein
MRSIVGHNSFRRRAFYANLLESFSKFAAIGEVLILGDFNARLGDVSDDNATNDNGPLFLEFLRSAFADGKNGAYRCLLNPTYGHHGSSTFRARKQTSIVDFIITSNESMHRVHTVYVENGTQARGANGIGSDHNLLYVGWKLQVDMPKCSNTVRQTWNITELEDPANQKAFQATLLSNLAASHADCPHVLETLNSAHPDINTTARQQAALDIYYHTFVESTQKSLASTVSVKMVGPNNRPYWDLELRELVKLRGVAYAEAQNSEIHSPTKFPAYWAKYISERQQVHALASRKKDERYQHLLTNIDTLFINDRRHFFREIVKLQKNTSGATQMHALRTGSNHRGSSRKGHLKPKRHKRNTLRISLRPRPP